MCHEVLIMIESWKSSAALLTLGLLAVVLAESSVDDRHHQHHNHHQHRVVKVDEDSLKGIGDDLTSPDVNFDNKGWRALAAAPPETFPQPETAFPESSDVWKDEEVQPQPPRRRRPGRKRKRRPYLPNVEGNIPAEQDGVRFNVESGVQVVMEDGDRPRPRRPQRLPEDQHWRGEARDERPHRRRGNRRRQRPYLPNLENAGQSFPIKVDTSFQVNTAPEAHIRVVGDDYRVGSVIDEVNGAFENVDQTVVQNDDVELTTAVYEEENQQQIKEVNEKEEQVTNNKSYRRPYSQAKKQENDFAMGSSSDLKALLKQSGGLSLSEVLQQRNLSLADLLTGKQHALSALKTPTSEEEFKPILQTSEENHENIEVSGQRRRLPPISKDNQFRPQRNKPTVDDGSIKIRESTRADQINRRRLPTTNINRRQKPKATTRENDAQPKETTTEKNIFIPKKSTSDNLISQTSEQDEREYVTESTEKNTQEDNDTSNFVTTTEEIITTTTKREEVRNRLSLKPRLRLPSIKTPPKRILNPEIKPKVENKSVKNRVSPNENAVRNTTVKKAPIPSQAIPISIKEMFGMSDIVSAAKIIVKAKTGSKESENTTTTSTQPPTTTTKINSIIDSTITRSTALPKVSAKDEILEILTDKKGGEKLAKILAERNMTLKELVEHRERGSSQVHLADIFHNASREPDPAEPFLAKSLIEPISKEIYPLKALLEGNMRDTGGPNKKQTTDNPSSPPLFVDLTKTTQDEESLGIVTLFDKFSEFVGHPKIFDAKDMKKDSDGSSYFTSVINVKPTDEAYKESRSETGFYNSHKQVSEIFSSIPTYVKSDNVVEAKVVPDWNEHSIYKKNNPLEVEHTKAHIEKDVDGDGLIVLDDLQRIEQVDNHIAQASNQKSDKNFVNQNQHENEKELNFYTRLPVGVRSAIIVSSSIIGTSLVVFLTIFVACKWRQRKRNLLTYNDSFSAGRVRSPILDGNRKLKKNSSSRSISPILTVGETTYKNQKINTMDSQTQREAQDYLWDSLRRPFQ